MRPTPFRLLAAGVTFALSASTGCETTTSEKTHYALSDGKSDSILDSRIHQVEAEVVKYPLRSDLHYQIASLHAKKGDCVEAVKALERAIHLSPDEAKYHFHLGRLYLTMNDLDKAEAEFRKSVGLSREGRYTGPHAALGWTLSLEKQQDAAIQQFEKCIQIDPEDPTFYYFLGSIHDIKNDREEAIRCYREYLARGGQNYRNKTIDILRSLGVTTGDLPAAKPTTRSEDIFRAPQEGPSDEPRDASKPSPADTQGK